MSIVAKLRREAARTERAAEALMEAFTWADSPEGSRYWDPIHDKLLDTAERFRVTADRQEADEKRAEEARRKEAEARRLEAKKDAEEARTKALTAAGIRGAEGTDQDLSAAQAKLAEAAEVVMSNVHWGQYVQTLKEGQRKIDWCAVHLELSRLARL